MDDRANAGRSEIILGKAIRGKRDHVVITSKVGLEVGPGSNDHGLSRFQILRQVERSLKRLNPDHIDVYLAHVFDDSTPLEETLGAFDDLVRGGMVRCVGCCNYAASQVSRALRIANSKKSTHLVCVQNQYNLLNRTLEREMFSLLRDQRLGFMAYGPLAVGLLSGVYSPEQPPPAGSLWARNKDWQFAEKMNGAEGAAFDPDGVGCRNGEDAGPACAGMGAVSSRGHGCDHRGRHNRSTRGKPGCCWMDP